MALHWSSGPGGAGSGGQGSSKRPHTSADQGHSHTPRPPPPCCCHRSWVCCSPPYGVTTCPHLFGELINSFFSKFYKAIKTMIPITPQKFSNKCGHAFCHQNICQYKVFELLTDTYLISVCEAFWKFWRYISQFQINIIQAACWELIFLRVWAFGRHDVLFSLNTKDWKKFISL